MTENPVLITQLANQMRYMAQRQTVLSQNIANLDTPGYKAKDLKKVDFSKMVDMESGKLAMTSTAPGHMGGVGSNQVQGFETRYLQDDVEHSPNGNSVTLEDEMAKVDDTTGKFQQSSLLVKKYTQLLHEAIGAH